MRRTALFGLTVLLGGCQYVGSPFAGAGGFIHDTQEFRSNPTLPPGHDETMQRVEGGDVDVTPLQPEPGDVWPGPVKPIPTMMDLQQQNNMQNRLPPPNIPTTPPPPLFPNEPTVPQATSGTGPQPPPSPGPSDQQPVLVPNGNGTSTRIGPDGSITTVPTPQ